MYAHKSGRMLLQGVDALHHKVGNSVGGVGASVGFMFGDTLRRDVMYQFRAAMRPSQAASPTWVSGVSNGNQNPALGY